MLSVIFIKSNLKCQFFVSISIYSQIIPSISQSFSSKQNRSASVPKSPPLFNSSSSATAQKPVNFISHICGLGASVGCERVERTFNAPRLKAQIWLMKFTGFVCCLLNELNSNSSLVLKHICGLGTRFECERFKRTFKLPRLKSQICFI